MKKVCIYCREENPDIKMGIIQDDAEVGLVYVCLRHAEMLKQSKLEIFVDRPATPEEEVQRKGGMD
jgi:hypothetical protein